MDAQTIRDEDDAIRAALTALKTATGIPVAMYGTLQAVMTALERDVSSSKVCEHDGYRDAYLEMAVRTQLFSRSDWCLPLMPRWNWTP